MIFEDPPHVNGSSNSAENHFRQLDICSVRPSLLHCSEPLSDATCCTEPFDSTDVLSCVMGLSFFTFLSCCLMRRKYYLRTSASHERIQKRERCLLVVNIFQTTLKIVDLSPLVGRCLCFVHMRVFVITLPFNEGTLSRFFRF